MVFFILYNINISLLRVINILLYKILIRFGIIQIELGMNKIINILVIQLNWILKIDVEGSKILNKFIIIFNYFFFRI